MVKYSLPLLYSLMVVMSVSACKNRDTVSTAVSIVADKSRLHSTIPSDDTSAMVDQRITFAHQGTGVAHIAKRDNKSFVIHNGKSGTMHEGIGALAISPDGSRVAYTAIDNGKWRFFVDGVAGEPFSVLEAPQFSPDGRHVALQVMKDDVWYLVVDGKLSAGANKRYREFSFSGDSAHIVYIDKVDDTRKGRLVVSDTSFKNVRVLDTGVTSIINNADRSAIAAIVSNSADKESVIHFVFARSDTVERGAVYDKVLNIALSANGYDLAYFGERQKKMYGVLNSKEELLPEGAMPGVTVINQSGKSLGALISAGNSKYLYEMFTSSGRKGKAYDEIEWLTYSGDGSASALAVRKGKNWCVVVNGKEGPEFDRIVSPKFSPDGKKIVYRARNKGERFVIVADLNGTIIKEHPHYDAIWDVNFTNDGAAVGYGVKQGNELWWKVEKL